MAVTDMWFFKHFIINYIFLEPKHTIYILKLKYKLNTSETSSNIIIVLKVYSNRVFNIGYKYCLKKNQ